MNIELERSLLEDLQSIESAIAARIQRNPELVEGETEVVFNNTYRKRNHKQVLLQQHEIRRLLGQYKRQNHTVEDTLWNAESQIKSEKELQAFADPVFELKKFDELYQGIKVKSNGDQVVKNTSDYYAMKTSGLNNILSAFASDLNLESMFSPQEYYGRYLELNELHELWLNLNVQKLNYIKYLEIFHLFERQDIPDSKSDEFLSYLKKLNGYLVGFVKRCMPLYNIDAFISKVEREFKENLDNATEEKITDPLYCKVCDKTFAKQTVFDGHISGKKHQKNLKSLELNSSSSNNTKTKSQPIELLKFQINQIVLKILNSRRQSTKLNSERKTALTEKERQIEIDNYFKEEQASDHDLSSSSDDDDQDDENSKRKKLQQSEEFQVSNPMNLPLGADGLPIPFWLWKLNGLGIEYNCEICGNFIYKGRKAFESHFGEKKHLHGLKCLGIEPSHNNTFKDITRIDEALTLWSTVKKRQKSQDIEKEDAVEVEDEEGNVLSEKVYNELKKQGLV
jgi:splicing factor 3A subunit 3